MLRRPAYVPHRDLATETIRVAVSAVTKEAVTDAARRAGKSASAFTREAVEDAIQRQARTRPTTR